MSQPNSLKPVHRLQDIGLSPRAVRASDASNHEWGTAMMKRSLVAGVALTSILVGPATAADLPTKAAPFARAACAQFGGFYAGGQVGVSSYNHTFNDLDAFGPQIDSQLPNGVSHSGRGALAGAQA